MPQQFLTTIGVNTKLLTQFSGEAEDNVIKTEILKSNTAHARIKFKFF